MKIKRYHWSHNRDVGDTRMIEIRIGRTSIYLERWTGVYGFRDTVTYGFRWNRA